MKKIQILKISVDSVDSLCTTNPRNRRKVERNFVLLPDKSLDYFLTDLKLVPNVQKSRKLNQISFLLERKQQDHVIQELIEIY